MSIQIKRRREAASFLSNYAGAAGELLIDITNNRVQVHDGVTPGGFPAAKLSEIVALGPLSTIALGAHGSNIKFGVIEELLALSGTSTSSTIQIPNRAIVFAVSSRTVTAVVGAPSYGVGPFGGNATQFGGVLGVAVGSNNSGVIGPTAFYSDTKVAITATSGSFTGGEVRVSIQYMLCGVPTS
jgi:hypothetical protein